MTSHTVVLYYDESCGGQPRFFQAPLAAHHLAAKFECATKHILSGGNHGTFKRILVAPEVTLLRHKRKSLTAKFGMYKWCLDTPDASLTWDSKHVPNDCATLIQVFCLKIYLPVSSKFWTVLPLFSGRMVGHDFVGHVSFREQNPMPMPYHVCSCIHLIKFNILCYIQ